MLEERLILELALSARKGPEGPSILQDNPAGGNRAKLLELGLALNNRPKRIFVQSRNSVRAKSVLKEANARNTGFVI